MSDVPNKSALILDTMAPQACVCERIAMVPNACDAPCDILDINGKYAEDECKKKSNDGVKCQWK